MLSPEGVTLVYILQRMAALYIIVKGWDYSSHSGWRSVVGTIVLTAGAVLFEWAIRRKHNRELMPYVWDCPICRNKGDRAGIESCNEDVLIAFKQDHNRTVHLME